MSQGPSHDRGQRRLKNLERHLAAVLQILGEIDRDHPACAKLARDAVAIRQRRGQSREVGRDVLQFTKRALVW